MKYFFAFFHILLSTLDILEWFLPSKILLGMGQYYIGIGEFKTSVTPAMMAAPTARKSEDIQALTQNYQLRVYSSGCYFRDTAINEWINDQLHVSCWR